METLTAQYSSTTISCLQRERFDLGQYQITVSVDETTPSIGTESVEQDDNTSTTADDTDTSVAVDIKEIAASAPVSPSPAPPVESEGMNGKSWSRWLFSRISSVLERNPDHVALVSANLCFFIDKC